MSATSCVERAERIRRDEEEPPIAELKALVGELRQCGRFDVLAGTLIAVARRALNQSRRADERAELAALLRDNDRFEYARQLYRREVEAAPEELELRRQYAFCIYKDTELPAARRFDRALEVLTAREPLAASESAETLGIAGAIYKRKWETDAKLSDLRTALRCYRSGYDLHGDPQRWYAGINAAFVLDQLAALDGESATSETTAWRADADALRTEIAADLDAEYGAGREAAWGAATLAEALIGLGRFDAARAPLERVRDGTPEAWKRQTTAVQLAALVRLRAGRNGYSADVAMKLVGELLGPDGCDLGRAYVGKVGLALSGGGFRASLFHVGVLAALAERDALRHVEALSCVSGGSIIGVLYYLKLRELLQTKADGAITVHDYVELVDWVSRRFLAGVRKDLRGRLAEDFTDNVRMLASGRHSRTDRAGRLFEELFFAQVDPPGDGSWRLRDLRVDPVGREHGFSPRYENWSRASKVPILVINATTLNTGHNWQFTGSWMGEPPSTIAGNVDGNLRLRRVYHADAPGDYGTFTLGAAVAASAGVPALFPPMTMSGLYENIDVELVDGGVHDNQGIASLLEQDCSVIVVSDASGQMADEPAPRRGPFAVLKRSNKVLMSRVRRAQYDDLSARRRSGVLRRLAIVHLKKGLSVRAECWIGCQDPADAFSQEVPGEHIDAERDYGIAPATQRALAELRTDLDAFTDDEALLLMAAGYQMAQHELSESLPDLPRGERVKPLAGWVFDASIPVLAKTPPAVVSALVGGRRRFFRRFAARRHRRSDGPPSRLEERRPLHDARAATEHYVATPARAVLGAPVALAGAAVARLRLRLLGRHG